MKVVLNLHLGADVRIAVSEATLAALRTCFPGVEFVAADDRATLAREARYADVFYGFEFPPALVRDAPRLRWIESISAGIERTLAASIVERGIAVTNGAGIAAIGIAEHVIAVMLMFCRNLHVAGRLQAAGRWDRPTIMAGTGTPIREFVGCRLAVLGLGPIGARELGLMRREAYLVNVVRGSVVDEDALVAALRGGRIAGAALDVATREPIAPTSPLWTLPNVILTPHAAGATPRYFDRALDLFIENLERFLAGRPRRNLVDPVHGYPKS